ncbi:MAG TPA: OB-fold nucleic acid binding domain-containing protein, partial [Candidatus Binatia bacterium]|nr:OB-fold nucleic acid binding domain-containing protein [Candidatus Binatia bacterium]
GREGNGTKKPANVYPEVAPWSVQQSLAFEKEALGFYITGHPLDKYDKTIKKITSGTIAELKEKASAGDVKIGGVVSALKLRNTKKGDRYGSFNLEDKSGFVEVVAWPDVYRKSVELLNTDDPIFVKGRMEVGEERIQIFANDITPLAEEVSRSRPNGNPNGKSNGNGGRVHLYVRESEVSADELLQLRETLLEYRGDCVVFLHLCSADEGETVIELPDQVRIASTPELEAKLQRLFGSRVSFHSLES